MSALPAAAEPRHPRGGAGGAAPAQQTAPPPWHRQKVKIPMRVWGSGHYSPGAVTVHAQITALAQRTEGCSAAVATLARYLGMSKRTCERFLSELTAPGPEDVPELITVRRTGPDGDGDTALRRTRPVRRTERFAYVPVTAAKTLRPALFVLYCALTYATATRTPVTAAELAEVLAVTERSARRMTDELECLGWITVHRRAGAHGRHDYDVHDHPLHSVPAEPGRPDTDGGSGASTDGGSLAIKEDAGLTDVEKPPTAVVGIRRRRPTATSARDAVLDTFGRRAGLDLTPGRWQAVWQILGPVRGELAALTGWEWQRLVTGILRQVDQGTAAERLADRIGRRYATMRTSDTDDAGRMRSFARWLIGAALVRHGCADPRCESGVIWGTDPDDHEAGRDCRTCAYTRETAEARARQHAELAAREQQTAARRGHQAAPQQAPDAPCPAPPGPAAPPDRPAPPGAPAAAPERPVGPPPVPGGWRALVARERPDDAARTYRDRWKGDHARHLPPTGT
ncbi:MAG TPA: hypothetical protein VFP69_17265 [Streptomyces sp.]|nr:hypothetical protein [Streptomyces sp.]